MPIEEVGAIVRLRVADLSLHPSCSLVPEMSPTEWAEFLADVGRNGVRSPLVVQGGIVLDGRHRWRAAQTAEIEEVPCRLVDLEDEEQTQYVISAALHRRNLKDSQRAMLAAKYREQLSKKSKKERAQKGGNARWAKPDGGENDATPKQQHDPPAVLPMQQVAPVQPRQRATESAAKALNVSEHKVKQAAEVVRNGSPELVQAVEQGKVSLLAAKALAQLPASKQKAIVAGGEQSIKQAMRQPSMVEELRRLQREKNPQAGDRAERVERLAFIQKLRKFADDLQDYRGDLTHAEMIESWPKAQCEEAIESIDRIMDELAPWNPALWEGK